MNDANRAVNWIAENWRKHFPGALLEYSFMDKNLNDQYFAEERFSNFFLYFSILSLIITCLGLLGLTALTIRRRVKEIGIRKVLGASVSNIILMFITDYLKLVIVSSIIAFPIAWYIMNKWLQNFAYKIELNWRLFVFSGGLALIITIITISFQAIRAATNNPVKSLRHE